MGRGLQHLRSNGCHSLLEDTIFATHGCTLLDGLAEEISQFIPMIWMKHDVWNDGRRQNKLFRPFSCAKKVFCNTSEAFAVAFYTLIWHFLCSSEPSWLALAKKLANLFRRFGHSKMFGMMAGWWWVAKQAWQTCHIQLGSGLQHLRTNDCPSSLHDPLLLCSSEPSWLTLAENWANLILMITMQHGAW